MAGATGSNQNVTTGRFNWAEGSTVLWGDVPPGDGDPQPDFNGSAILIVEVAKEESPDNEGDYEDGENQTPSNRCDGIIATGWSGGSASNFGGTPGGVGVIGRGGANQGTGVVGLGGGRPE